jgi:hypothetical protein
MKPAGSPLEKTGRIHDPSKFNQVKEKKLEYDPPQRIEEDRTLVNPFQSGGPERNHHIHPQANIPNQLQGQGVQK